MGEYYGMGLHLIKTIQTEGNKNLPEWKLRAEAAVPVQRAPEIATVTSTSQSPPPSPSDLTNLLGQSPKYEVHEPATWFCKLHLK